MADYLLKEWLTRDEAACWLSDQTGQTYTETSIQRALNTFRLTAHYWPTDNAEIGLFALTLRTGKSDWRTSGLTPLPESPLHLDTERCSLSYVVDGPVLCIGRTAARQGRRQRWRYSPGRRLIKRQVTRATVGGIDLG